MISTKDIARGDQIWNTYDDPPNADLLRKYGHVDLIPLEFDVSGATPPVFPYENPADEVEIRADLILDICLRDASDAVRTAKVNMWLFLGGEEYVLQMLLGLLLTP
jgi:SET domain-containing protein 6